MLGKSGGLDPVQDMIEAIPFPTFRRGKVRDVFDLGDRLLVVASDRLSAFDVVLPTSIPNKGELLTAISNHWFGQTSTLSPNHLAHESIHDIGLAPELADTLAARSVIVRKAERIDIECVVRGNLAGSGWKEYREYGTLANEPLPVGLRLGDQLAEPRFTPATKNDSGHDENISRAALRELIGEDLAGTLERVSLEIFEFARGEAARAGFILADTKFEFGFVDGTLVVIDELLTPDSSRYWDAAAWQPGLEPPSFDKQVVRDWLEASGWNKEPPGPVVPHEIVTMAADRYKQVYTRLQTASAVEGAGT
jgi:phosphoribosylaminoimidazole-succinocarboxamide synthase